MRSLTVAIVLAVLGSAALAGCTAPEEDDPKPERWGTCPQWLAGAPLAPQQASAGASTVVANESMDGYALDMFGLLLSATEPTQVRFYAGGEQRGVTVFDPEPDARPFVTVEGEVEVRVFLTAVRHGTAAMPGPLELRVEGGTVEVTATPWYRVCGQLL